MNVKFANGGKTVQPLTVIGECEEDRIRNNSYI